MAVKETKSKLNNFQRLNRIVEHHQHDYLYFEGGAKTDVDAQTARVLLKVYRALGSRNQAKFRRMIETKAGFNKVVNFAWSKVM